MVNRIHDSKTLDLIRAEKPYEFGGLDKLIQGRNHCGAGGRGSGEEGQDPQLFY